MNIEDFKHGCNKQAEDPRDRAYKPKLVNWTDLEDIDLRKDCSVPRAQGNIGSCTAFATTSMFDFVRRKNSMVSWQPSPLFTYYATRKAVDPVLTDSGATVRDALKSAARDGVSMERVWPYVIEKYNEHPPEEAWNIAEKHQALEYLRINDYDKNEWLNCLNDGYPFVFGINLYESFFDPIMQLMGGFMIDPDRWNEKIVGAHCMMAVGYIKNYNGKKYVIVQNSWGTNWGDKGYCYIPLTYMMSNDTFDFWTIRLTETSDEYASDPVEEVKPEPEPLPEPVPVIDPPAPEPVVEPIVPPVVEPVTPAPVIEPTETESKINPFYIVMAIGVLLILVFIFG
jgi:C1A family cysteine protease